MKPRMTIVDTVYHQIGQDEPTSLDSRFSRDMNSDEQVYIRQLTLNQEWKPLDIGWIEKVGMLCIQNKEGTFPLTKPTDEERAEAMARVVELALIVPEDEAENQARTMWSPPKRGTLLLVFAKVRPLECIRFEPQEPKSIVMRCVKDTAKVSITVIPD